MAKKEKKKNRNKGYGKVIVVLGILLALAIGANIVVPDMVKDIQNDRGPFETLGSKISEAFSNMKKSDEEATEEDLEGEDGEDADLENGEGVDIDYSDMPFLGSWVYELPDHNVIFTFNPDGSGSMTTDGYDADMKYSVDGDIITMNYYLNGELDETEENQYQMDGDILILIQNRGEGTRNELKKFVSDTSSTVINEEVGQVIDNPSDFVLDADPDFTGDLSLVGSWAYQDNGSFAVFTFNDDGTGLMIADGEAADIRWSTSGDLITMEYYVDGALTRTEENGFSISNDTLSLTSDSGNGKTNNLIKQ